MTSFIRLKVNIANIVKGNKPTLNSALLKPRELIFLGRHIILHWFYVFIKAVNRSNRVVLKNIKLTLYSFQRYGHGWVITDLFTFFDWTAELKTFYKWLINKDGALETLTGNAYVCIICSIWCLVYLHISFC